MTIQEILDFIASITVDSQRAAQLLCGAFLVTGLMSVASALLFFGDDIEELFPGPTAVRNICGGIAAAAALVTVLFAALIIASGVL